MMELCSKQMVRSGTLPVIHTTVRGQFRHQAPTPIHTKRRPIHAIHDFHAIIRRTCLTGLLSNAPHYSTIAYLTTPQESANPLAADHVYLVCEPPGEPYYLGRIMEFLHPQNDKSKPVDAVRINWFYRPRDIGRKVHDTRVVFATMHSDISPLTALRGKCQIRHRVEIANMDEYRRTPDSFWFEKLYDRYIQKNYDLVPTSSIVNVPEKVKKVLDERWKFVIVEQGRGKELTSAVKLCKRCSGYCARYVLSPRPTCACPWHLSYPLVPATCPLVPRRRFWLWPPPHHPGRGTCDRPRLDSSPKPISPVIVLTMAIAATTRWTVPSAKTLIT